MSVVRRHVAMLAVALLALVTPAASQDAELPRRERPYVDDRSTAVRVVASYYSAISRGEYARAWSYLAEGVAESFETLVANNEQFLGRPPSLYWPAIETTVNGGPGYELVMSINIPGPNGSFPAFYRCYQIAGASGLEEGTFIPLTITREAPAQRPSDTSADCGSNIYRWDAELSPSPYLDDRSSPGAVVRSLYNAIDRGEYARAWSYFAVPPETSFEAYVAGFADTGSVSVSVGGAIRMPTDAGLRHGVPALVTATARDGTESTFSGCYFVRDANPGSEPGSFVPFAIVAGELAPGAMSDLVDGCSAYRPSPAAEGEEGFPPGVAEASARFAAEFGDSCLDTGGTLPSVYPVQLLPGLREPEYGETTEYFYFFTCRKPDAFATTVVYASSRGFRGVHIHQIGFAEPVVTIDVERDGRVSFVGVTVRNELAGAVFDASGRTLHSSEERADGSAITTEWSLRGNVFMLTDYEVFLDDRVVPVMQSGLVVLHSDEGAP
ncbi:MAG: hypothetical protein KIS96_03900 [Bauldia sp.]|nr:hypothetical protein [Bauldia sp.]